METGKKSGKGKKEAVCCLVFLLLLYGLWAADLLCPDRLYSDWEKRLLAQKPAPEAEDVLNGSYMEAYEEWLTDPLRASAGQKGDRRHIYRKGRLSLL